MRWRYALAVAGLFLGVTPAGCGGGDCDPCTSGGNGASGEYPPTGLRIESVSPGGLILIWQDNAPTEIRQEIERVPVVNGAVDDSAWRAVGQQVGNLTWFVDESVDGGQTYRYRVSAYDRDGRIGRSDTVDIWVPKIGLSETMRVSFDQITATTAVQNYRSVFLDGGAKGLQFVDIGNTANVMTRMRLETPVQSYRQLQLPTFTRLVFGGVSRTDPTMFVVGRSVEDYRFRRYYWGPPTTISLRRLGDTQGVFDSPDGDNVYFFVDEHFCAASFGSPNLRLSDCLAVAGAGVPMSIVWDENRVLLSTETGWYVFDPTVAGVPALVASHPWGDPSERVVQMVRESPIAKATGESLGVWARGVDGRVTYLIAAGFNAFEGRSFDFGLTAAAGDMRTMGVTRNLLTYTSCADGIFMFDRNLLASTGDAALARAGSYEPGVDSDTADCFVSFTIDGGRGVGLNATTNELVVFAPNYARSFPALPELVVQAAP